MIGRELVLSTWYGRRHRIHSLLGTQRKMFFVSVYLMPLIQAQQNVYNIAYSQAVTHPSTNTTQCCLTSVIGRELVLSTWYGRRQGTVWKIDHVLNNVQVGLSPTGWLLSAHYTRAILWQNCSLIVSDHYQMPGVRVPIPTTAQNIKLARNEYFSTKFVSFSQTV